MSRLLLVSNRLPVTARVEQGRMQVNRSAGGLATGLSGPHAQSQGLWVGWPGDVSRMRSDHLQDLENQLAELRCVPLFLSNSEVNRYYEGFSNGVLWPLFHYLLDRIPLQNRDFEVYRRVNQRFADKVVEHYQPGDTIWVHDYQLMLVPQMLREQLPEARIGFFLHIPFPSSEVFLTLPWREEVMRGMLGADLIGFHTVNYTRHFITSMLRLLGLEAEGGRVTHEGRELHIAAFPMGIDAEAFDTLSRRDDVLAEVESLRGQRKDLKLVVGVDRLDYTKGLPQRMLAFQRLLEREPSLRNRVRFIQVAVPSRDTVEDYAAYRKQVDELVGRINGSWGTVNHTPIHYLYRSVPQHTLGALYRGADVMLVTPIRDGMNLVAKEFCASRSDGDGVLILSEFAGASGELAGALKVNPYDVEGVARALKTALTMPEEERRERMGRMRARVAQADVHHWVRSYLEELQNEPPEGAPRSLRLSEEAALDEVVRRFHEAEQRVLLLDYDGTLVPLEQRPELAWPRPELLDLLGRLGQLPRTEVHVVSGRPRDVLETWLGELSIGLHAEHGLWSRDPESGHWHMAIEFSQAWKPRALKALRHYADRLPGSLVEEKTLGVAWHYRQADPESGAQIARELRTYLMSVFGREGLEVLSGDKVIELRPRGVHKGLVVEELRGRVPSGALLIAAGDDRTDEDMFAALSAEAIAIRVGSRPTRSASLRVADPAALHALLRRLL